MAVGAVAMEAVRPVMGVDQVVLVRPVDLLTDRSLMLYSLLARRPARAYVLVFKGSVKET